MWTLIYRATCLAHRLASAVLRRERTPIRIRFVDVDIDDQSSDGTVRFTPLPDGSGRHELDDRVPLDQLFPVENASSPGSNPHLRTSFKGRPAKSTKLWQGERGSLPEAWRQFIDRADIPEGYRNAGLKYAGYIASGHNSWCLPTWIWTNAATVRCLCALGDEKNARAIGDRLLSMQEEEGGWIVRSDYTATEEIPVMAPNDSAYIANNACLSLYSMTGEETYLLAARRCADWIMRTARPDGLVWTGYDKRSGKWIKKHTIVDTGFTAGLFANLCLITGDVGYLEFLQRFVNRFIDLFQDPARGGFATSIDETNARVGGRFARGQAWALEGLIPAYAAVGNDRIRDVVAASIDNLLDKQLPNGGWAYNLDRPYFGEDCKGVPVIAKSLLNWYDVSGDERLPLSAQRALDWCKARTALASECRGGIFSFNLEGAVVHNLYTETAFVYSSAYALETLAMLPDNA